MNNNFVRLWLLVSVLAGFLFYNLGIKNPADLLTRNAPLDYVEKVLDGDTVVLKNGDHVRYIGIDTPELTNSESTQCFAHEGTAKNRELVEHKEVKLVKDTEDKDKYGRLLRYVYLTDDTFINLKLVSDGYARVLTIPPNTVHANQFYAAEKLARDEKLGLWAVC